MGWRIAGSLARLRDQINAAYPTRNKASDGVVGDAAHASSASDHNPNSAGVVCAMDITHSPQTGFDAHALADRLRVNRHPNLKYIISNRRICGAWTGWAWWAYNGSNPHSSHVHFSVGRGNDGQSQPPYDDATDWAIGSGAPSAPSNGKPLDQIAAEVIAGSWGNGQERIDRLRAAGYDYSQVQSAVNARLGGGGAAPRKSNDVIAAEVLAGAWGNGDDRKRALQAAGYDYNAVQAIVNGKAAPAAPARASVDEIANQVIAGAWGSGDVRRSRLQQAGYNYDEVQSLVNRKLGYGAAPAGKTLDQIANEVIAGNWGNGPDRQARLRSAGYDPNAVQSLVNKKLGY